MPPGKRLFPDLLVPALMLLCACSGGGGSSHNSSPPRTNIDLAVTSFSVTPSAADPEDPLTLSGTIQNLGTETANPAQGDKFYVRFNLSTDGTFELNEQGFLEMAVTDPIPAGGSLPISCTPNASNCIASYDGGDTFAIFGNFCSSQECIPPETGVVGVKVDSTNAINEIEEGNNFQFQPIEVVGTRVAATQGNCDFGLPGPGQSGCELTVTDGLYTTSPPLHRPCTACGNGTDIVLPHELHPDIWVTLSIRNCTKSVCGGSWLVVATTGRPGSATSTREFPLSCNAFAINGPDAACTFPIQIRDPNY